jgi:hypothetical protein
MTRAWTIGGNRDHDKAQSEQRRYAPAFYE